jgi:molybdopterin converting factor small subunit
VAPAPSVDAVLREFAVGQSAVRLQHSPASSGEALSILWTLYPGPRDRIATEPGEVRQHINIFIGDENARTGDLASPLPAECEISIVPAVSGG